MEFFEVLKNRHSARKFKEKDIGEDKLMKVLEAANSSPSAGDLQAYEIVVVRDKERRERLANAAHGQEFIRSAPLVLVFLASPGKSSKKYVKRGEELYCVQDATIAAAYAQLSAAALGLGCVWVGGFEEKDVADVIGAKQDLRPVVILPIGYAAEQPRATTRRNIDELAHDETL